MKKLSKFDYSILIGNSIDHFDTALYGFLAPILAPIFFPNHEPDVALIIAYSIFATSLFTRPFGAFIFGLIAQSHGASRSLGYSLIGVAATTLAIGLIPSYDSISILAPILLIVTRALRGIFSAGEITVAKLYILERKNKKEALKASYFYQTSSMIGIVLASLASTLIIDSNNYQYWRLCFIIGGVITFACYFLRKFRTEKITKFDQSLFKFYSIKGLSTLWQHKLVMLRVAVVTGFSYTTYSIPFIVMNSFIPMISDISFLNMMSFNTTLLVIDMLMFPAIGKRLLQYSATGIMTCSLYILASSILPLWYFLPSASILYVCFVRIWIVFWGVVFACPINLWQNNLVKSNQKYIVTGIGSAVGISVIGKMTPAICFYIYHLTKNYMSITIYMIILMAATLSILKVAAKK